MQFLHTVYNFANISAGGFTLLQYGGFFLRIIVSCLCGLFIGAERSRRFKEAGVRTHIIVCMAACLIMIVSKYGFEDVLDADKARIAAQAVSGISFLGAGIIFHTHNSVKGLTTAAGVWATAGIGLAIGAGLYTLGIFSTVIIYVIQFIMHRFEFGRDAYYTSHIHFSLKNPKDGFRDSVAGFIKDYNGQILDSKINYEDEGIVSYNLTVRTSGELPTGKLIDFLEENGEVKSVSHNTMN
ncbi:MAG: MgtC/SapB family protein [Lachnospiraceae bacterium]|nr:MgtC/SapB family protein [Lachnospiraceae bacterium]